MSGVSRLPRLVLLSPEPAASSETFIRAHRERLPFDVVPLYRWRPPYQTLAGGWLARSSALLRLLAERLRLSGLQRLASRWADQQVSAWLRASGACCVLAEYGPLAAGIAPACRRAHLPLVVIFHGFDAYMEDTLLRYRDAYRDLFASAAALVAVSAPMRQQLISLGAPAERITVNPCGVDPQDFPALAPASAPPSFLAVGRFVGKKGPLHTLRAFALVHQAVPASRLTMIGDGPLLASAQQLAAGLGVIEAVTFLGACSHDTVQAQLRQVRVFVQHSLRCQSGDQEGTPVALIEAQMSALPVVSTRHAGIPAVVLDGQSGFLVEEGDIPGMAAAMLRLARDPLLAGRLGAAGRDHALHQYTLERHITALAATIHSVVADQALLPMPTSARGGGSR